MPTFRFKLDALLRARQRAEQAQQRTVASLEADRVRLEDELRGLQDHIRGGKDSLRDRLAGVVAMHDLRLQASASMHLLRRAQRAVLELAGVHQRLEAARADLKEARAQRRALEMLRERRLAEWKTRLSKAEDRMLDDIVMSTAGRHEE